MQCWSWLDTHNSRCAIQSREQHGKGELRGEEGDHAWAMHGRMWAHAPGLGAR